MKAFSFVSPQTWGDSDGLSPESPVNPADPLNPVFYFQGKPDKLKLLMIKHSFRKYFTYFSLIYFIFGLRSVAVRSLERSSFVSCYC